jgi:hypothetical protein
MKHRPALLLLLLLPLAITGCSDGNSSAPAENEAHPLGWITAHPTDALAVPGFDDCIACHGKDLQGSTEIPGCYSCHSYNTTPPLSIHPADWTDPYINHRAYATANGFTSCTPCHGSDLHGSPAAPGCFSASFDGRRCHADGPGQAPHPLDGTYLEGANHGPDAKSDLTKCQGCHGQAGGPGSNPRFNIGIDSINGTGCEGCHGTNYAHPADWAGPNATFHYSVSASAIQNSCTLCHGAKLDGDGGVAVGVSCLKCHNSTTTFTLDCTSCHAYPPDGTADVDIPLGVAHGNVAGVAAHDTCVVCHGMKESNTGGSFAVTTPYRLFDKSTDTQGSHWNGRIDMNASAGYDQTNFGCNACHANDSGHQLSDSGLPVVLSDFGYSSAVPHPLDGTFLDPLHHGPAAKGLTAAFPDGMADCQPCHGQAGTNPRFNVGINSAGGNGCESCHNDGTAHPSADGRETFPWYDGTYNHSDVAGFTACTLCHGANLGGVDDGGVGPACTDCHAVDPVVNASGCVSCHNLPPNGLVPAGDQRPNRRGQHNRPGHTGTISASTNETCSRCHNGAGVGTAAHFDTSSPADVNFLRPDPSDTITAVSTDTNTTCTGACHIKLDALDFIYQHTDKTWYP